MAHLKKTRREMKEKPKRLLQLLQGFLSQPDRPDKDKKFKFIRIRTIEAGEIRLNQHGSNADFFCFENWANHGLFLLFHFSLFLQINDN